MSNFSVGNLRCEYMQNPLGLGVAQLQAGHRGARQSAYRIVGASSAEKLASEAADLWDSGKVESEQSVHVQYGGSPVGSMQRAWWKVRVWNETDRISEYSENAWWEMGLQRSDWAGQWIGASLVGGARTTIPAPFLRREFAVEKPISHARLYATALGLYEFAINGQCVGDIELAPGWTEYNKRVQYQAYDVTALLHTGANTIGAILGDGWYSGHVEWRGRQRYGDRPKLLAHLVVFYEDGSSATIVTDALWKTAFGPIVEADMLMGESYDARLELGAWSSSAYDDTRWLAAETFDDPGIDISPMIGPAVKRIQELKPVGEPKVIYKWPTNDYIFDLGQNMVGRVRLKVSGPRGTTITLRHAEVLNEKGNLYADNLRTARQTDYYTLKGDGEETWEPRFTFHGFRYVELSGLPEAPAADAVTGIVLHSDTPATGSFECSDPLINQLQHNIEWGQKGNFVDIPTDCPQRDERLGWTGDAQVFIRTACWNMDVAGFFTKWQRDIADAQTAQGAIPSVVPNTGVLGEGDGGPAWADAAVICPWTIYLCYGDRALLETHYESFARYMSYLGESSRDLIRSYEDMPGFRGFGDWLALDGSGKLDGGTPKDLIGTAFYAHCADLMGRIARVLDKDEDAIKYDELLGDVKTAFIERFTTPQGLVAGGTQTGYVLALHFNLLPLELREAAVNSLVRDIKERGNHLSTGFVGSPYIARVLSDNGELDVAYSLLHQKTWPSWLYAVTQGATTIWERWDGWTHDKGFQDVGMNSFNHYAYGAIGAWLYSVVAGIEVDEEAPGYKRIVFRPQPGGGLTHARASLNSIYGEITSHWRIEDDYFNWNITVPPNTTATVYLPTREGTQITESGTDAGESESVMFLRREADAAVFEVEAGEYSFVAQK
jgi:alpha-L-rhamnosidase